MLIWCLSAAAQSSLPPPPPPPVVPYGSRHMRPPSSPPYGLASSQRDLPSQSPIGRDLPALPTTTRPNSSMSILSMLGTDPGRPSREAPNPAHPTTSQPNGTSTPLFQYSTSPTSPTKPFSSNGPEHQGSPPAQNVMSGVLNRPFRAYSGGSVGSGKRSSPSASSLRFDSLMTGSPSLIQIPPRSAGTQEPLLEQSRHMSTGRTIDRPNSQPTGYNTSAIDFEQRAREIDARRAELARQDEAIARNGTGFSDRARNSSFDLIGRQRQESSRQPPFSTTQGSPRDDRMHTSAYPFLSNSSVFIEPTTKGSRAEYNYTPRDRVVSDEQASQHLKQKSPFDADGLRRLREEHLSGTTMQQQQEPQQDLNRSPLNARPRFLDNVESRQEQKENRRLSTVSSATGMERTRSIDSIGRNSEDIHNHRHSLAIMLDNSKRGRISPLPQAVQGAQGRPSNTPSRDPGIKNEFSKMFAGIGSGVTGVGGSGASTPFPPSPKQSVENEQRPFGPPSDTVKITESRNGSRMGKRRTKIRDDEVENNDGRVIGASAEGRGIKRAKHSHRHHVHGHQYVSSSSMSLESKLIFSSHHREEGTPLRNVSNPNGSTPVPHHNHHLHHHHHHADGTIHHHHHTHTKQAAPTTEKAPPPPRMPRTIITNTAVLSAVQNHPRHHLGSAVYAPTISPSAISTSLTSKIDNLAGSYAIPTQFGKENCTLTVRVPRFYLTHSNLLHTTARRAVWGTDIYTDDSDPLCAAIHAGWIRGAWPAAVDVNMLEPDLKNVSLATKVIDMKDVALEAPPTDSPLIVPKGKDMYITILILPALQYYASRVVHGLKSRAWGTDHDGLSFKIEKIAFLDGGEGTGEEKSATIRKERLTASVEAFTGNVPEVNLRMGKPKAPTIKPAIRPVTEVAAAA